jgi:HK97 family phage major capsid protein
MDLKSAQKAYAATLAEAKKIISEAPDDGLSDEQQTKVEALAAKTANLAKQIELLSVADKASQWSEESAGSYVASSFDREAMPGEGNIKGVSADVKTGELYAIPGEFSAEGQKRIDYLKSGAYKDAFVEQIRAKGLNRQLAPKYMKILNEGTFVGGEAWLPPDFRAEVIKRMAVMATVRPNARVYNTGTDIVTFPKVKYTGGDKYTSGVSFTWRGQALSSDISEATNPIAGQERIPVNLATAAVIVDRSQLEDNSFDLLGYLGDLASEAFALGEEDAYTNGTGNGQPVGFLNHPSMAIADGATGTSGGETYTGSYILSGSSGAIAWGSTTTGILGVETALPPQYETNAKWYATKATFAGIRSLNAGTASLPQWSLGDAWPNYANGMTASLLGYGIVKNQFMPTIAASAVPLVFGDMTGYYIVDRVGLSVEVFREVYGLRDQVVVYMRKRTGGQLVHYWKLKNLTCTA